MPWECALGWAGYPDRSSRCRGPLFRGTLKCGAPCFQQGQHVEISPRPYYKTRAITDPDRPAKPRSVPSSEWGLLNVRSYQLPPFSLHHTDFKISPERSRSECNILRISSFWLYVCVCVCVCVCVYAYMYIYMYFFF